MYSSTVDVDWCRNTVIYHVYLPSFVDSNGDGLGDFQGLTSKLDYFEYLKIDTLMLSPFFPSPMHDNGYDVSDFLSVDTKYGAMEDFDNFMTAAKAQGMNIILDLPINHTSHQHEWFQKSIRKQKPYTDYYVWVEPKFSESDVVPPNNWVSVFGGSAWEWNNERDKFYLHQFLPEQPDLNLRNPDVRNEIKEIFLFWLRRGVDGFRIDAASHLFEDEQLRDEPQAAGTKAESGEYDYFDHIHTKGHPANLNILHEWRDLLSAYQDETKKYILLLAEVTESLGQQMRYYGDSKKPIADVPFNFALTKLDSSSTTRDLHKAITSWMDSMPTDKIANWIPGNHDLQRFASRFGADLASALHMVILLLPGVVFCYYGDELGMEDVEVDVECMRDSFALRTKPENSRDPSRTPMQWNDDKFAGFTTSSEPWLPIHSNYKTVNVEVEKTNPQSVLEMYRKMLAIRKLPSVQNGLVEYPFIDGNIFSMIRLLEPTRGFLVILNMGLCASIVNFTGTSNHLPKEAILEVSNNPYLNNNHDPDGDFEFYKKHSTAVFRKETGHWTFCLDNIFLLSKEAMVLSFI